MSQLYNIAGEVKKQSENLSDSDKNVQLVVKEIDAHSYTAITSYKRSAREDEAKKGGGGKRQKSNTQTGEGESMSPVDEAITSVGYTIVGDMGELKSLVIVRHFRSSNPISV